MNLSNDQLNVNFVMKICKRTYQQIRNAGDVELTKEQKYFMICHFSENQFQLYSYASYDLCETYRIHIRKLSNNMVMFKFTIIKKDDN